MAGPLIAVFSPKGGVGKTLISAGLALHLVRRTGGNTMLIDLHAGKADVAPLLQVALRPSLFDYMAGDGKAVTHPTGLMVLPGPARLVDESLVTGELALSLLTRATGQGYTVVADVGSDLRDSTVMALEHADAALLVTTPDLLSIYAARRFVQEAGLMGIDPGHFRVVINRAAGCQEIPEAEILDLIGLPLIGRVPSLPGLAAAVNRGMISATARSGTDFAQAMKIIADGLAFAGVNPAPAGRSRTAGGRPVGLIPALRRWWGSL
ncbi:MAG TPA: hypothetical protein VGK74_26480 [Symbiobacteriaceae bacterium]